MSACTLEALPLTDVEPYGLTVGDMCTLCYSAPAPFKVVTFRPADRAGKLHLAGEYRACGQHEQLVLDAAHSAVSDATHLVRTVLLFGHPRFGHGLSSVTVCESSR